uniref:Non-specific protein-tyrosine kinase n=1 Tax=Caenorhabditis tropicalis TaxID=1561998 RepID=A0A1I7TW42_9PELO
MSKSSKSPNQAKSSSSVGSICPPTARSPSMMTAEALTDPRQVPTALSNSVNTAIGPSDFESSTGLSDTSAGSGRVSSNASTPVTAKAPTSPEIIMNDLKRGSLFGRQNPSQSVPTEVSPSFTCVTFSNDTTNMSTASQATDGKNLELRPISIDDDFSESTKTGVPMMVTGRSAPRGRSTQHSALRNKSRKRSPADKMNELKKEEERQRKLDEAAKKPMDLKSKKSINSKKSAKKFGRMGGDKSQLESKKSFKSKKVVASSKKEESLVKEKAKNSSVYLPGVMDNNPPAAEKFLRKTDQGKSRKFNAVPSYNFPGAGKCTRDMGEVAPPTPGLNNEHVVYDVSKLPAEQRRVPVNQPNPPKSLFGNKKQSVKYSDVTRSKGCGRTRQKSIQKTRDIEEDSPQKISPPPASCTKIVVLGTTPDGKNMIQMTIDMQIVAGEALKGSKDPIQVIPKKVMVAGKTIPLDGHESKPFPMNVLIQGAVQALGYCEDGKYHREPDCYETIRDLIRYLREDGEDHTARLECGRYNLIEHDLVPMVKCEDLSEDEFDIAIRLMVNLCQPAIATMRGKAPGDRDQWKMYWELEDNLRRAKLAFTDPYFFVALKKRVDSYFIDTDFDDRDERLRLVVERIVLLVKYVFSINQDTKEGRRTRIEDSSHDRVVLAFLQSGIDKTLMHIANQPREKEFHVTILDIFALMLKEQCPEALAKQEFEEISESEKRKTEEEFRKIIENHVVKETQKRKSFTRFGGSYTIQGMKGLASGSNQVVFKPIQNVEKHNFLDERKTKKRVARNRRPFEIDSNTHLASSEVMKQLRDMVIRLIETCFNRLMKSAKSTVFVQGHVLQKTSQINYFFMVKFVLRFVRMSKSTELFERISVCTGVEAFHENNVQLTEYVENATTLKGVEAKSFGLKAQYALGAYNELVLIHRYILENGKDEQQKKMARRALEHVVNVEEYRELPIHIMKKFSCAVLSNNFLRELILTTHHYMRLVERFVKTGALKKVTKKVKVRKNLKKKKRTEEDVRAEFDQMTQEQLDGLWEESKEILHKILKKEAPEMEDMNPINQQLDVDEETHQKFARLAIQRSLRSRGFPAAVGLFHACQRLWPEAFEASEDVEEEMETLRRIAKMDLKKVAKEQKKAEANVKSPFEKADQMTEEALDDFWNECRDRIHEILNGMETIEDVSPLNWQLEVTPETQQQFAMLSIQRSLRLNEISKALGIYRASRKLWPEENIFGSDGMPIEDEIQELEGILKADLKEVQKTLQEAEHMANQEMNDVDEGEQQQYSENSEDEEEETPAWKVEEIDFQFDLYLSKFANVDVLKWYVFLLNDFSKNSGELNQALVKMLHRIAFDLKMPTKLFQISLFQVFQKVNEHFTNLAKELQKSSPLFELYQFGYHLLKKFFTKYAEMGEELAVEALFWKGPKECFEIENGYGSWIKNKEADIKVWTEEMETELRNLYDEYRTVESPDGIDVLDFIEHNLSRARTRKQIAKKLIEFGLDLLGAKWKNLGKSEMDSVLPIGDIRKWYEEWKEGGSEGDVVEILQEKLTESLGSEISRKKIIKQLAHMDIGYEKPKKERPLPEWSEPLIEELRGLKEQYEEIHDAENLLGVDIVRYVMKRLSEKKPTRHVERYLASMGAKFVERAKKEPRKKKKVDAFLNDDSGEEDPQEEEKEGEEEKEEEVILKKKRVIVDDSDDEEPEKSPEKVPEKPKSPPKNTLMSRIANKKRKFAQLESDDSEDSSDSDGEEEKKTLEVSEDDHAAIYKRSYVNSLLTSGSVADSRPLRETSEEKEEEEDPFTKKIQFKRRIVMESDEDEDN